MKKLLSILMAAMLLFVFAGCSGETEKEENTENGIGTQIPNPIKEMGSGEEIESALGFTVKVPDGSMDVSYSTISSEIAQAQFTYGDNNYVLRASKLTDDFTGVYEDFEEAKTITTTISDGTSVLVTYKAIVKGGFVALWTVGEISYSLYSGDEIADEDAESFASSVVMENCTKRSDLTLDALKQICAEKGQSLTWSDFEGFNGIETGSGLYIVIYEIDDQYSVMIGGVPKEEPMYVYLSDNVSGNSYDLRKYSPDDIIAGNAEPISAETGDSIAFSAEYLRTDGYTEGAVYPASCVIRSTEELAAYYEANKDKYNLERGAEGSSDKGFLDAADAYDDEFFQSNVLICVVLEESSGSIRHTVTGVVPSENGTEVTISREVPEMGTDDMAEWHILIAFASAEILSDNVTVTLQ